MVRSFPVMLPCLAETIALPMPWQRGELATECSVGTHAGVKVANVLWMSPELLRQHGEATPYPQAPELCVAILSRSSSSAEVEDKVRLDLGYGAHELWTGEDEGQIRIFGAEGRHKQFALANIQDDLAIWAG